MKSDNGKTGLGLLGERELLGQRGLHFPPPPIDKEWLKQKNALTYVEVMKTSSKIPKKDSFQKFELKLILFLCFLI